MPQHPSSDIEMTQTTNETWPNGVPKISDEQRQANLQDPVALRDLVTTLWLYIGRYAETQLTTEQKELLADAVDSSHMDDGHPAEYHRWWRGQ